MPTSDDSAKPATQPANDNNGSDLLFVDRLEEAVEKYRTQISETKLPALSEEFQRLHGSFKQFYSVLIQKALISEDPYKYSQKISEIVIPDSTPLSDSEQSEQIGIRLSQYDSQLEFLITYYHFSVEFLTLKRIKLMAKLAKFINWESLSDNSASINTRSVAIIATKVRGGSDNFASQVIRDAQKQMADAVKKILHILKDLTMLHREAYKLAVRQEILVHESLPELVPAEEIDRLLETVRKAFTGSKSNSLPFYQDLVREVIAEDYTAEGANVRKAVLASLAVEESSQKKTGKVSLKPILLEAVRTIGTGSRHLESALAKINTNGQQYEEYHARSGSPLRRWLQRIFAQAKEARIYEVEYLDIATSATKNERIDFDRFLEEGVRLAQILASLTNKMSPRYSRIEASPAEEIYAQLERITIELQKCIKKLPALQEFFSAELPRENRDKLRGIKLELNGLKNAVVKANQKRHEYLSRMEEEEQLKKLGIENS